MKLPRKIRPGELTFTFILLILSLIAFYEAYQISGFSGLTSGGVLPMLASGVMLVSGIFIVKDALHRRPSARYTLAETAGFLFSPRLLLFATLLALYAAAIPWLGFIAASSGFLFISIAFLWRRGFFWSISVTVIAIAVIYVIFRLAFKVILPLGSL
jgi:hypothetical protein